MEILLTRYHWLQLSNEERAHLRSIFQIPRSGGVETQNGKLVSDGSNENDLRAVNVASMQSFLGQETAGNTSFEELFEMTVARVRKNIAEEQKKHLEEEESHARTQHTKDIQIIVSSLLQTFYSLPIDAQAQVRTAVMASAVTDTQTEDLLTEEHGKVKKAGRPKKAQETSNEQGTEGTGSGS